MTISRTMYFATVDMIKDERRETIMKSLQQVINTYQGRGFRV